MQIIEDQGYANGRAFTTYRTVQPAGHCRHGRAYSERCRECERALRVANRHRLGALARSRRKAS